MVSWILFTKTANSHLDAPFGAHRGNVCTSYSLLESLSSTSYSWWSRRFSKGVGQFKRKFHVEGDVTCQPLLVSENLGWLPFHVVSKYRQYIFSFCHKVRVWRKAFRTDRITTPKTALTLLRRAVNIYRRTFCLSSREAWLLNAASDIHKSGKHSGGFEGGQGGHGPPCEKSGLPVAPSNFV